MRFMLIGTGFGAAHLGWITESGRASVDVLCYRHDRERAIELAKRFGVPEVSADPLPWINSGRVDALAVVTPPGTHERFIEAGLAAGLLVVTDKPLTADLPAAARLVQRAQGTPGRAFVTFQWRTHTALLHLREQLAAGRLGRPIRLDLEFHHDFLSGGETLWPWRHQRGMEGAGVLGDQGVHLSICSGEHR